MKYEKPQKGHSSKLVINQHLIPVRTISRFAGPDGKVEAKIAGVRDVVKVSPNNGLFSTRRAWDQRAEQGYMKQIEDRFQNLADRVLTGEIEFVGAEHAHTVNMFYALWHQRSRHEPPGEIETQVNGLTGHKLSQDEQEALELKHILYVREGGKMPTRQITGIQMQAKIDAYARQLEGYQWGVVQTEKGEFLVPDVPSHTLMPIAPKVMLAAQQQSGMIRKPNLIEVNTAFLAYTRRYFFARSVQTALSGITAKSILKAVKARDARFASELNTDKR